MTLGLRLSGWLSGQWWAYRSAVLILSLPMSSFTVWRFTSWELVNFRSFLALMYIFFMNKVWFVYDDIFLKHIPPSWHRERKERLISVVEALKTTGLWNSLIQIRPRRAFYDPHADIRVTDEGIKCIVRSIITRHSCPVFFTLEGWLRSQGAWRIYCGDDRRNAAVIGSPTFRSRTVVLVVFTQTTW